MPGSRHYEDRGKHLGANRIAQQMAAAAFPVKDLAAERAYYTTKLGFEAQSGGEPSRLRIPGGSGQQLVFESLPANPKPSVDVRGSQ